MNLPELLSMNYKEFYVAPETEVLELKSEGVICQSTRMNVAYDEEDL